MESSQPTRARTRPAAIDKPAADPRTPRAIRFSESEWERIRIAAARRGISFASFVREAAMIRASTEDSAETAAISPELMQLIRHTFRYSFAVSTMKRNELIRAGHREDVDKAVELARKAEAELLSEA